MNKTETISIRINQDLKQEIAKSRQTVRPTESETAFIERACWERIKLIEREG